MQHFDIIGVAGNAQQDWGQPSWGLTFDTAFKKSGWQSKDTLSGRVMHQQGNKLIHSGFGPWPRPVHTLDGLFMAVRVSAVLDKGVQFDPQFAFHCYDIDFCRSAHNAGLRLGTWPIAQTHASSGNFGSTAFKSAAAAYLDKWARHGT